MHSDCFQELSLRAPCFVAVFLGVEIERRLDSGIRRASRESSGYVNKGWRATLKAALNRLGNESAIPLSAPRQRQIKDVIR